jgi:putative two-component system response regulator
MEQEKKAILAVDDIIPSLHIIKILLEDTFKVYLAKSIEVASGILKTSKVDLILLDIEMPGMSGFEYLKHLREMPQYCDIPVIFVTSYATKDFLVQAMNSGAKDFIAKPISLDVLKGKIYAVLGISPEEEKEDETISPEKPPLSYFKFPS